MIVKEMTQISNHSLVRLISKRIQCYSTAKTSKKWTSVVGLEIHAQIATNTKLFAGSRNNFADPVNSSVALFDASIPGTLPVLNKKAVEAGVKTALALSCKINEVSMFDRKHYFYADLPVGYQITQQRAPLANDGTLTFPVSVSGSKPYLKTVRLHQLQLEQDSGKSLHDDDLGITLIDLNRAGVPLMELVFDPDLSNGEEAAALVKELVLIFTALETCNCRMEEGSLRVDANISIHQDGEPLGTRSEVKNISSFRAISHAIEYEINRQIAIKDQGGVIVNETRSWDAPSKSTVPMRDKEIVHDYRFMPEPNLPPLHLNLDQKVWEDLVNVKLIADSLPILPQQLREKLVNEMKLTPDMANRLVNEPVLLRIFTEIIETNKQRSPKVVFNILGNELLTLCNKNETELKDCAISTSHLGELIDMRESQEVNANLVALILQEMMKTENKSPRTIAEENNWKQISDETEVLRICEEVLATEPVLEMVRVYKTGKAKLKPKLLLSISQRINNASGERINMTKVVNILKEKLDK